MECIDNVNAILVESKKWTVEWKRENERRYSLALSGMTDNILLVQAAFLLLVEGLMNLSDHLFGHMFDWP
jgi:hypothetical protein